MKLEFLGHAGFLIEGEGFQFLMDPWLNPMGAYDAGWFQFPCNHHLTLPLLERLHTFAGQLFVYLSHDHEDHFDRWFLNQLPAKSHFLLPDFQFNPFQNLQKKWQVDYLADNERYEQEEFELTILIDESGINRDSAIRFCSGDSTFLNLNDCKIGDRISEVCANAKIDIFTCQFSGATWHPVCYSYAKEERARISKQKRTRKFKTVLDLIKQVNPIKYIPAAGPAIFLDHDLFDRNFEPETTFPKAQEFCDWLQAQNFPRQQIAHLEPGDSLLKGRQDGSPYEVIKSNLKAPYSRIEEYRDSKHQDIEQIIKAEVFEPHQLLSQLQTELALKVARFTDRNLKASMPFVYFSQSNLPEKYCLVDLLNFTTTITETIAQDLPYYLVEIPSWALSRVLSRKITWEELSLSFRVTLKRVPDQYDTLVNLLLFREVDELDWALERLEALDNSSDTCIVSSGVHSWRIAKLCPHQGAELSQARIEEDRFLVCPRHGWRFDLSKGGVLENGAPQFCIAAKALSSF